jgi:hypothetical protein
VDQYPQAQNLTFNGVMANSTAAITSLSGSFAASNGTSVASFALLPAAPNMTPFYTTPVPAGNFTVLAEPGQPSGCNSGVSGPQPVATPVFCPAALIHASNAAVCTDNDGTLCGTVDYSPSAVFGYPVPGDGTLQLAMDEEDHTITVTAAPASLQGERFSSSGAQISISMSGTIGAPLSPPGPYEPPPH